MADSGWVHLYECRPKQPYPRQSTAPSSSSDPLNAMPHHQTLRASEDLPPETQRYLAHRLDGARDLYLLALAIGTRDDGAAHFGRIIREARIHFVAVIEEARIAGLDTTDIGAMLGKTNLEDGFRPDLRSRIEQLLSEAGNRAKRRETR